jgi:inhibitor of KinA
MPQRIYALSHGACTVSFGSQITEQTHLRVMGLQNQLAANPFTGWIENVAAYTTLTVYYEPAQVRAAYGCKSPFHWVKNHIEEVLTQEYAYTENFDNQSIIKIPVCYERAFAPDLARAAEQLQMPEQTLIQLHSQTLFKVFMIGFLPGFPYMGTLAPELFLERKAQPVREVAAGSVAIAREQTGIYPQASPGGWHVIGRTPIKLFDLSRKAPSLLQPGDRVQMYPISAAEFHSCCP